MNYNHDREEHRKVYEGKRPTMPPPVVGYYPHMKAYLDRRGLSYETALHNGWYPTLDMGQRIVIPCSNSRGVPYWQARAMDGNTLRYKSPAATREDSIAIVWTTDQRRDGIVIVEGPLDALAAATVSFDAIAIMGNDPAPEVWNRVADLIHAIQPARIVIVPDLDMPEFGARAVAALGGAGLKAGILFPAKKDLADMSIEERRELLRG